VSLKNAIAFPIPDAGGKEKGEKPHLLRNQTFRNIPSKYFWKSEKEERLSDIYKQWTLDSPFLFLQQSVVPQEKEGEKKDCHYPARLYSGLFSTPNQVIVDAPEARRGGEKGKGGIFSWISEAPLFFPPAKNPFGRKEGKGNP